MSNGLFKGQMIRAVFPVLLGLLLGPPVRIGAAEANDIPPSPARVLNQKKIHQVYTEGDFDGVIVAIDSFTRANKTFSHSDSVFIAKHLAVIYTANPQTREKGKNYMFRLLNLLPSAKIVDMFVSDEIDHIFEKVREEYIVRQESLGQSPPTKLESNRYAAGKLNMNAPPGTAPDPSRNPEPIAGQAKGFPRSVYWIAGGITLAAIGGAAFFLLQPEEPADRVYDLPE
jgi:hypothetical protein